MILTRQQTSEGIRWALDGARLPQTFTLALLLELPSNVIPEFLAWLPTAGPCEGKLLPPLEPMHEVWASGVTYLRSREARQAESEVGDVYARVYDAPRPELFLKAIGWRVVSHNAPIRVRDDSQWDVPEPELTLVINGFREIVGFCVGNDVSSRSIEGQNPLYLPQAKIYTGSCALGPGIQIALLDELVDLPVTIEITRREAVVFQGQIRTSRMKRPLDELVAYLTRELAFPQGVFLMTGTGIVPPDDFTLKPGDNVRITIGELTLENHVHEP